MFGIASRYVDAKDKAPASYQKAGAFFLAQRSLETPPNVCFSTFPIHSRFYQVNTDK